MNDSMATTPLNLLPPDPSVPLRWPPPGLERIHGAIWQVIALLAVGGLLMTGPMLWTLSATPPFWSPGPFGDAWWLPGAAAVSGLGIVMTALVRIGMLMRAAGRAAESGYDGRTIAHVACDASRDGGDLLQGQRQYEAMSKDRRGFLLDVRTVAALAYATGLLWIPVAFTFGIVLATRGAFEVGVLWSALFWPAGTLLGLGLLARAFDTVVTRRAFKKWRNGVADVTVARREADAWMQARVARLGGRGTRKGEGRAARYVAVGFHTLAVVMPLPIVLLALLATVGPLMTQTMAPRLGPQAGGIARTQILEPYTLPTDPSIGAAEAGRMVHMLTYVGRPGTHREPVELAPMRVYAEPWIPEDRPATFTQPEHLVARVFEQHQPITLVERAFLERAALHPGHVEFARLARAARADIAGGRWDSNALQTTNMFDLPVPRLSLLRDAARMHLAIALLDFERGDIEATELAFREVVSVGLLLVRDGITSTDMLMGSTMAHSGAHALRLFYDAVGRDVDANAMRLALDGVDRTQRAVDFLQPRTAGDGSLRNMMAIAANTDMPPGLRWQTLMSTQLSANCLNANAALFGRGSTYDAWLDETHETLVRYPSEEALFRLMSDEFAMPEQVRRRASLVKNLIRLTFGAPRAGGSCAGIATAIASSF